MKKIAGHPAILPGFKWFDVDAHGVTIRTMVGGQGPPLLLLHGHPQTHLTWHKIAPELARRFTVVATDLRGYGDSAKPEGGDKHINYSKRAMAADQVAVMAALGFKRFKLIGHDRGGRVAHRLALDHPDMVEMIVVLDIAPTAAMYAQTTKDFATRYFWWFFLIQPYDLPERMIAADPDYFFDRHIAGQMKIANAADAAVLAEYRRCYRDPATRHAICEDYRAAAGIDLEHDADGLKVAAPLLALWGSLGVVGDLFDVMATWRARANDVRGFALPCGHSPQEECPEDLMAALGDFL